MSSRCSSAWFFQGLWCRPTSEAPIGKIKHYGISGMTLAWISDFLIGRTQRLVVDGSYSEWSTVHWGVPQGTVLGPLFLLYINNLPDCITSRVRLFADDCLVCRKISSFEDKLVLQRDLDAWKSGQVLGEWNLTQVNAPFFPSQDPLPCINFTPYVVWQPN